MFRIQKFYGINHLLGLKLPNLQYLSALFHTNENKLFTSRSLPKIYINDCDKSRARLVSEREGISRSLSVTLFVCGIQKKKKYDIPSLSLCLLNVKVTVYPAMNVKVQQAKAFNKFLKIVQ